jgi:hypothetical protein
MNVLVVSLLLIALLVAGLMVALVDPDVPGRLLARLRVGGSRRVRREQPPVVAYRQR